MLIHPSDNVEINLENGHKYAIRDIKKNEDIIKYGEPIGHAVCDIRKGEHVHSHNLVTNLERDFIYKYEPYSVKEKKDSNEMFFEGYVRKNGSVGTRNDIWIVNTVGCVNKIAQKLSSLTGAKCFPHPYGCSQLGDDLKYTQYILKGMVNHPNAGGILVLGLGCENNNITVFKKVLGNVDENHVKFLNAQDYSDEISEGVRLINELKEKVSHYKRQKVSISKLKVGLKCGGSDGYSGISANPLVGRVSDEIISMGGSCVLTEVPEMFGAEHLLMKRCRTKEIFDKTVKLIENFKKYYTLHGHTVYENPSPGNKEGGITTLEEKSLGCIQKGGYSEIEDVLEYGDIIRKNGLSLLNGPGNDMVAVTNLMAAGVQLILFTTGRGTPLGGAVPTVKIASNEKLATVKKNWIDFDASLFTKGEELTNKLLNYIIDVANGKKTKNEENEYEEIAIFKDGVTL